jgi:ubiquinone/menaquinone biosynthesis C-methylase UbiE
MDRAAVRRAWDEVADDYAEMRNPDGEDAELIAELLAALPAEPRVLDIGCGDGMRTLRNLGAADAIGLDVSRRQLELAGQNVPAARLIQADMTALPLADDSVDAVTAYHAVFHVSRTDHPEVYREVARVLRPGGLFLTTVGSGATDTVRRNWLGSGVSMYWSTPGLGVTRDQLADAGLSVRWVRSVDDPLGSSATFALAALEADRPSTGD